MKRELKSGSVHVGNKDNCVLTGCANANSVTDGHFESAAMRWLSKAMANSNKFMGFAAVANWG